MTSDADERLLAPYRPIRRVGAADAPWPGMLVRLASGESRTLVDAREFGPDWAGWRADPEGHVLAPLDVVRRADGHSVVLPVCVERVEDFLARRTAARIPLSLGETVTLGVSLVRGLWELDPTPIAAGEWWLTDAGRPMFASDARDRGAADHTGELLRTLADGSSSAVALRAAAEAAGGGRRSARDLRLLEEDLFAAAAPEPLVTSLLGPRRARDLGVADRDPLTAMDEAGRSTTWIDALARHVDADLADVISRATTGVWRRLRRSPATSRRPWLLAACAAAVVLIGGMLWPTGVGGPATADMPRSPSGSPVAVGTRSSTAGPSPSPSTVRPDDGDAAPADLVDITNRLLGSRSDCAGDRSCLAAVVLDPATRFETGAIDLEPSGRTTTLLDDFGGVAVLRVDAVDGAEASQLVVVMLDGDRWLLRDVHVAKQP